jgi:hypothetical protein
VLLLIIDRLLKETLLLLRVEVEILAETEEDIRARICCCIESNLVLIWRVDIMLMLMLMLRMKLKAEVKPS